MGPPNGGRFVDAFCGMGSVAAKAASLGWPILANDHLAYATVVTAARLTSSAQVPFKKFGGYEAAIAELNEVPAQKGFLWREYSPAAQQHSTERIERRYFTEENAARIDAIRGKIASWLSVGKVSVAESRVLIADLISATNRVANIAGTYGCFLASWSAQSRQPLEMRPRDLLSRNVKFDVTVGDVRQVRSRPADTMYLDPPYTKRQYASYYHVLETITVGDEPSVHGVAGLRPWQHLASDYCYKRKALNALDALIEEQSARRIMLSYSSEGHIGIDDLYARLETKGAVQVFDIADIGRYRPNQVASDRASSVTEHLILIDKDAAGARRAVAL